MYDICGEKLKRQDLLKKARSILGKLPSPAGENWQSWDVVIYNLTQHLDKVIAKNPITGFFTDHSVNHSLCIVGLCFYLDALLGECIPEEKKADFYLAVLLHDAARAFKGQHHRWSPEVIKFFSRIFEVEPPTLSRVNLISELHSSKANARLRELWQKNNDQDNLLLYMGVLIRIADSLDCTSERVTNQKPEDYAEVYPDVIEIDGEKVATLRVEYPGDIQKQEDIWQRAVTCVVIERVGETLDISLQVRRRPEDSEEFATLDVVRAACENLRRDTYLVANLLSRTTKITIVAHAGDEISQLDAPDELLAFALHCKQVTAKHARGFLHHILSADAQMVVQAFKDKCSTRTIPGEEVADRVFFMRDWEDWHRELALWYEHIEPWTKAIGLEGEISNEIGRDFPLEGDYGSLGCLDMTELCTILLSCCGYAGFELHKPNDFLTKLSEMLGKVSLLEATSVSKWYYLSDAVQASEYALKLLDDWKKDRVRSFAGELARATYYSRAISVGRRIGRPALAEFVAHCTNFNRLVELAVPSLVEEDCATTWPIRCLWCEHYPNHCEADCLDNLVCLNAGTVRLWGVRSGFLQNAKTNRRTKNKTFWFTEAFHPRAKEGGAHKHTSSLSPTDAREYLSNTYEVDRNGRHHKVQLITHEQFCFLVSCDSKNKEIGLYYALEDVSKENIRTDLVWQPRGVAWFYNIVPQLSCLKCNTNDQAWFWCRTENEDHPLATCCLAGYIEVKTENRGNAETYYVPVVELVSELKYVNPAPLLVWNKPTELK